MRPHAAEAALEDCLAEIAEEYGTPAYVYSVPHVRQRARALVEAFGGRFELSFAVKSNPNPRLLSALLGVVDGLDVSSAGELERALAAGWSAARLRFTGPAKRSYELEACLAERVGAVVLESVDEARALAGLSPAGATGAGPAPVLVRIGPARVPAGFGVRLAGKPSRFGIDEEDLDAAMSEILGLSALRVDGLHAFVGTQCLDAEALVQHLKSSAALFRRVAEQHRLTPRIFVFGAGFGIPYAESDEPFDLEYVARASLPALDELAGRFPAARLVLELGRYLVGEAGLYLTRVQRIKRSRGSLLAICDGGMHHNLAACGHLGSVLHRNYRMFVPGSAPEAPRESYDVVGPLCTAIDTLGRRVALPELAVGSIIAVRSSGAYGLTASPVHFLGHPAARELLFDGEDGDFVVEDVSVL